MNNSTITPRLLAGPLSEQPIVAQLYRHRPMQSKAIGAAIGLKIVSGQDQPRCNRETLTKTFKAGLSSSFNQIQVDHHGLGELASLSGVHLKFRCGP